MSGDAGRPLGAPPGQASLSHEKDIADALRVIKRVLGKVPRANASDLYILNFIEKWHELAADYGANLKLIRPYTGKNFSTAKGYNGSKRTSVRRARTVARYANITEELLSRDHVIYVPPKQVKKEAFIYTGQEDFRQFTKAIVFRPAKGSKLDFAVDADRPEGSRFTVTNRKTGETSWHIPDTPFWDIVPEYDEGLEDFNPEHFERVLRDHAEDGDTFMIQAGDHHMWGSAGNLERVGEKLADLFAQYGDNNHDPNNSNSHNIKNWFRGITVYSNDDELRPYLQERGEARVKALREAELPVHNYTIRLRLLRDGSIGLYIGGRMAMNLTIFQLPQTFRIEGYIYRIELAKGNRARVMYNDKMVASVHLETGVDTS